MGNGRFGRVNFDRVYKLESNIHQLFRKEKNRERLTIDDMIVNSNGQLSRSYIQQYMRKDPKTKDMKLSNLMYLADSLGLDLNISFVRRKKEEE